MESLFPEPRGRGGDGARELVRRSKQARDVSELTDPDDHPNLRSHPMACTSCRPRYRCSLPHSSLAQPPWRPCKNTKASSLSTAWPSAR